MRSGFSHSASHFLFQITEVLASFDLRKKEYRSALAVPGLALTQGHSLFTVITSAADFALQAAVTSECQTPSNEESLMDFIILVKI